MKLTLSVLLFLSSQLTLAMPNKVSLPCAQEVQKKYMVEGSWAGTERGARTWDFMKLMKAFESNDVSPCEIEALDQASNDSREYWQYIKTAYHCPSPDIQQCDAAEKNLAYVDLAQKIYQGSESCTDENSSPLKSLVNNTTSALTASYNKDICSTISEKEIPIQWRKNGPGDESNYLKTCLSGLWTGFVSNLTDMKSLLKDSGHLIVQALKGIGKAMAKYSEATIRGTSAIFWTELLADDGSLLNDIKEGLQLAIKDIKNFAKEHVSEWKCMNGKGRAEYVCRCTGYMGTDALTMILLGKIIPASALQKVIKPVKDVMKSTEVAKTVAEAAKDISKVTTYITGKASGAALATKVVQNPIVKETGSMLKTEVRNNFVKNMDNKVLPENHAPKNNETKDK